MAERLIPVPYEKYDAVRILLIRTEGSEFKGTADLTIAVTEQFYERIAVKYTVVCPDKRVNRYMLVEG